jgi:SAM-dependent methyltransferase
MANYHDYIIKNGKLIGQFEEAYKSSSDPWDQSESSQREDSRRLLAIKWCEKVRKDYGLAKTIELGCGFGHLTGYLSSLGFNSIGTDISQTAINKASMLYPNSRFFVSEFDNFNFYEEINADIYLMPEITWYVLDRLDSFLNALRKIRAKRQYPIHLIHLLSIYKPGVQKYGTEKFTNQEEIVNYFSLDYIEYGQITKKNEAGVESDGTYFIAKL